MIGFIDVLTCGGLFILSFIVFLNPSKNNILANKWLSLFLFSLGLFLLHGPFISFDVYIKFPFLINVTDTAAFIVAPSLYLSTIGFVVPGKRFESKDLLHFMPTFILVFILFPFYYENVTENLNILNVATYSENRIPSIFLFVLLAIYWFLSFRKIYVHQKNIRLFASFLDYIDLIWLRNFLLALVFMLLVWLNEIFQNFQFIRNYASIFFFIAIYYLGYHILSQKNIFGTKPDEISEMKVVLEQNKLIEELDKNELNEQEVVNLKRNLLSEEQINTLKMKLEHLMTSEKPYLESTLNLTLLAKMMDINPHELSYLLNKGFKDNFFGFVNNYRIEKSKILILYSESSNLNMLGITYESGFNSKSTFYTAFKKSVKMTPAEFRKLNKM